MSKTKQEDKEVGSKDVTARVANVNVNLGRRIGLPNYSDARVGVSLTLPCDLENVNETYEEIQEWCFTRLDELTDKALETGEEDDGA